ncbi:hypothetical protein HMPREF9964_1036 [Streptococcus dysgalactiae subsp. equisimilis SK1249]|nr:hypothetical protein HMPREF9964_1036 [Streptococcus dysgalactiae subsp. equisimilis SK1249]
MEVPSAYVAVDVTESPIQRPQKIKTKPTQPNEATHHKNSNSI